MNNDQNVNLWGQGPHYEEAKARWGHSSQWAEVERRGAGWTPEQLQSIQEEGEKIYRAFVTCQQAGHKPSAPEAMALAEIHRAYISRFFYECTLEIHVGLATLYVADERFTAYFEALGKGAAAFTAAAIEANAVARA